MLQKFDPTRFTLRQDRPNGTQAPEVTSPQVSFGHLAALLASDPILREQVLPSLKDKTSNRSEPRASANGQSANAQPSPRTESTSYPA